MIVDAHSIESDSVIESDLCIVGGGVSGIALAREFIGRDLRVCLLESGGLTSDPKTQSLAGGDNVGLPYYSLETARARQLGGSSTLWHVPIGPGRVGARLRPLDPIDFEKRDWVPFSGWPFTKKHVDLYYERAQAICQVEPASFAVEDWEEPGSRPRLRLHDHEVQTIIYKFLKRDLFAVEYPNEVGRAKNVTIFLHANVLEIDTNPVADHVTGLQVGTIHGKRFSITGKVFVLAAGGIEVPRLLLLSNKIQKTGLGNQNDLVGRFFMEHPHFWQGIFVPAKPEVLGTTALYNEVHAVNGVAIIGKLALTESALRSEKLLNQNVQLIPQTMPDPFKNRGPHPASVESLRKILAGPRRQEKIDNWRRHLRNIIGGLDSVAIAGARKIRNQLTGTPEIPVFYFANMMEQIPNSESRVALGSERDFLGQRRIALNWRILPEDIRSAIRTQEIIAGALERAGLGRFFVEMREETPPDNTEGGYHHMGTTRMAVDPKQGVVDAECRIHGIDNLFIAGPSIFPTGGYANPVLTLIALTLRLADHLKKVFL
jgi:choline dehydrogenase-like flavoprotein